MNMAGGLTKEEFKKKQEEDHKKEHPEDYKL